MRTKWVVPCCLGLLGLAVGLAGAQNQPAGSAAGLKTGPASVSPHWSKYVFPTTIPEGAPYVIIEKGDTLWDLAAEYLGNPFLWPQIWDGNKYITDAHWIYPGDPLLLPRVAIVAAKAGELGPEGMPLETEEGAMPSDATGLGPGEAVSRLYPITEPETMLCSGYVSDEREDESFKVVGSELGRDKVAFAERDVLYLNKGRNSGVKSGDLFTILRPDHRVKHPETGKNLGWKIDVRGTLRVILVQDDTAAAVVEQACADVLLGDYLLTTEPLSVPMALRSEPAHRLTPPSGKAQGFIVDIVQNGDIAAAGHIVTVDLGSAAGVAPGSLFVAYRDVYPKAGFPRYVLGELAVIAVREKTATAKVMYSSEQLTYGDRVELR